MCYKKCAHFSLFTLCCDMYVHYWENWVWLCWLGLELVSHWGYRVGSLVFRHWKVDSSADHPLAGAARTRSQQLHPPCWKRPLSCKSCHSSCPPVAGFQDCDISPNIRLKNLTPRCLRHRKILNIESYLRMHCKGLKLHFKKSAFIWKL